MPLANPAIEQFCGPDVQIHVAPPGDAVTVYRVIGLPPSEIGAVRLIMTRPFPGVIEEMVGDVGPPRGV